MDSFTADQSIDLALSLVLQEVIETVRVMSEHFTNNIIIFMKGCFWVCCLMVSLR